MLDLQAAASFSEARIREVDFTQVRIDQAVLYKTQFAGNADFSEVLSTVKPYPHLDFHNVQFDNQEHTIFLKTNLTEVSFVDTDITRVRFGEDVV